MGRKKINIDWDKVDSYLKAQCSGPGIAAILGVHENTLYNRCLIDKNVDFGAYAAIKKGEGREILRAKQFKTAMDGDKTMLIWLGKQYLEQSDKIDHSNKGEKFDFNNISTDDLIGRISKLINPQKPETEG
jgi:hypothetical protein